MFLSVCMQLSLPGCTSSPTAAAPRANVGVMSPLVGRVWIHSLFTTDLRHMVEPDEPWVKYAATVCDEVRTTEDAYVKDIQIVLKVYVRSSATNALDTSSRSTRC